MGKGRGKRRRRNDKIYREGQEQGRMNISPRLLKEVANEIIDPLLYLFNLSLSTGTVPNSLKMAKVIPVYKKGVRSLIQNYRPISLLSIFDKILEKTMYSWLYNFLSANDILYSFQSGFRKKTILLVLL